MGEARTPCWPAFSPSSCFILPGLFLVLVPCMSAQFYLRHLLFQDWPESPLHTCWRHLANQREPDFHNVIWSQFSVSRRLAQCSLAPQQAGCQAHPAAAAWVHVCLCVVCSALFLDHLWPSGTGFKCLSGLLSFKCLS